MNLENEVLNIENIKNSWQEIKEAFIKLSQTLSNIFAEILEMNDRYSETLEYLNSKEYKNQRKKVCTLELTSPNFRHQVLDRKPKRLNIKII